jgi:hypothetical protein
MPLGAVAIDIHDGLRVGSDFDFYPLEGTYSVMLHSATGGTTAYISQTGDIPTTARSIRFLGEAGCGPPTLSLNGTVIPTSVLYEGDELNPYHGAVEQFTADIRAFTGEKNVTLRFDSTGSNTLDYIQFSAKVVPEPSMLVLFATGAGAVLAYVLRRRRVARG